MKSLLKTIIVLCFLLPGIANAQCPVAGSDSSETFCPGYPFDLSTLLSADADTGGVYYRPNDSILDPPIDSLNIPGMYTYYYVVSDTNCANDTAVFMITIYCFIGGTDEITEASKVLAYPNPATDQLMLYSTAADDLVIYDVHGKCVFRQTAPLTSVIDVSQLDPGFYLLLLQQDGVAEFQRFMKVDAP